MVLAVLFCSLIANNTEAQVLPGSGQSLVPLQLPADQQLFNSFSGFFTSVTQRAPGPKNPPCPTCALDLNFIPLNAAFTDFAPLAGTPPNEYGRMSWHSLEPELGKYDFSILTNVLAPCPPAAGATLCLPEGVKFGFRIMAINPQTGSDTNVSTGSDGYPIYSDAPSYLQKDAEGKAHGWMLPVNPADATLGHYFIPDWNDSFVLRRMELLLSALGEAYDADPRIGSIDIGLYGDWGEWHTAGLPDFPGSSIPYLASNPYYAINTQAYLANTGSAGAYEVGSNYSKNFIIGAHLRAFPDKHLVMLTDDGDGVCTALFASTKIPVGLRRDSLGSYKGWKSNFPLDPTSTCTSAEDQAAIANRWQIAPFLAEAYGNGSSPTFPCQSFETDPNTGQLEIGEQVPEYHIAGVKNASFCKGTWKELASADKAAVLSAGLHSGYRYAPSLIEIPEVLTPPGKPAITVFTHWTNTGVTPAYDAWRVEYSLWKDDLTEVASFFSMVDLRGVLPTPNHVQYDHFLLPASVGRGNYEMKMRVIDPEGYMKPMQLALQGGSVDGYYPLGRVSIPLPTHAEDAPASQRR